jgi:hypothetical protein
MGIEPGRQICKPRIGSSILSPGTNQIKDLDAILELPICPKIARGKFGVDRNVDQHSGLLLAQSDALAFHVLPAQAQSVGAPLAGVERERIRLAN